MSDSGKERRGEERRSRIKGWSWSIRSPIAVRPASLLERYNW
jgi:hypothetical protein